MKTLDQIAIEMGADKGSSHPVRGHDYARHYDAAFSPIRATARKVMEIGVGSAESIKIWLDYFPEAHVTGIDIVQSTNLWNTAGLLSDGMPLHNRYTFVHGDQSSEDFWKQFVADHGDNWDILVDDGGHSSQQIITTFNKMWPHIKPGGFYAIEDLNCAYSSLEFFCTPGWPNHMQFIKDMLDQINRVENSIDRMHYSQELCILKKK